MKFWYHYNKPASRSQGCNILTVHFKGACHLVKNIVCNVPTATRARKSQPLCVIAGDALEILVENETAFIS